MLLSFHSKADRQAAASLYHRAVMQARTTYFYTVCGVPDSVDGRFDMLNLHVFLVIRRLKNEGRAGHGLKQALFDHMFVDMERSVREMGVGDLGVPKHMRRMMKAFNGRCHAYEAGLAARDSNVLVEALARNLYGRNPPADAGGPERIAAYVRQCADALAGQDLCVLKQGEVNFLKEWTDGPINADDAGHARMVIQS